MNPGVTVFVVDDNEAVGMALERLLRSCGYTTKRWNSARTFLAEHDPDAPGCLVTDLMMPDMGGMELQQALSSDACPRQTILLTASDNADCLSQDSMRVFRKPISRVDLMHAVQSALMKDATARAKYNDNNAAQ